MYVIYMYMYNHLFTEELLLVGVSYRITHHKPNKTRNDFITRINLLMFHLP